jgi:phage shock protein C
MNCARCGKGIDSDSVFCRHCGTTFHSPGATRRLVRLPSQGRIAGVCAGIADYLGTDVTLIRLLWVILSIVPGALVGGVIAYIAAWIVMPHSHAPAVLEARIARSVVDRKIGGVCGGIAEYLAVDSTVVRLVWVILTIIPGAIVLGIVAYLVAWLIMPQGPALEMVAAPHGA